MSSIIKSPLHNSIAEGIYSEIASRTSRYYYFLGKTLIWDPVNLIDSPEMPVDTYKYELATRNEIITAKQINVSDVCFIVTRYDWTSGEVYDQYDDNYSSTYPATSGATSLETAKFYVLTTDFNVYKCVSNNYGAASTSQPTGTSTSTITTADGYKWKYMMNVPVALRNKFLTSAYMPVTNALRNQFYARGSISSVVIENGGSGYSDANPPIITVQGDGYIEENPYILTAITVQEQGDGYVSAPSVTISDPSVISGNEVQATGTASLTSGKVTSISLDEAGYGYDESPVPTITIAPPFAGAFTWTSSTAYALNDVVKHVVSNKTVFYRVTTAGTTGLTGPTHVAGAVANGTATLTYIGIQATAVVLKSKTEATIEAVVSGGEIVNVVITDPGIGYTFCNITLSSGQGSGGILTPNIAVGNIDSLQSSVELLAVNGSIENIVVTNQGVGYGTATVVIDGDGTGAAGTVTFGPGGTIESITMTNIGSGYSYANVTISGNGTGATARAIMSPKGGHGKNAVNELFAKNLLFYSTVSTELNQGFTVVNDYRQLGIIKDLVRHNDTVRFNSVYGSSCYAVYGAIDATKFPIDTLVTTTTGKRFRVVAVTSTGALLQSLDNAAPTSGTTFKNSNNETFSITTVTAPDFDKFSGDLLFIDNRQAFTPTGDQIVTLRTVIRF